MSPDDVFNDSRPGSPQSWNLYAYVRNNPLRFIDPTGRECTRTSENTFVGDCASPGDEQIFKLSDIVNVEASTQGVPQLSYFEEQMVSRIQVNYVDNTPQGPNPNNIVGGFIVEDLRYLTIAVSGPFRLGLSALNWVNTFTEDLNAGETEEILDYNQARNKALKLSGLGSNSVPNPAKFNSDVEYNGRQSPGGKRGFRVEYDDKHGAHINWWNGKKAKGTIRFNASQKTVNNILKRFNR